MMHEKTHRRARVLGGIVFQMKDGVGDRLLTMNIAIALKTPPIAAPTRGLHQYDFSHR